jgi:hypothetical protein
VADGKSLIADFLDKAQPLPSSVLLICELPVFETVWEKQLNSHPLDRA